LLLRQHTHSLREVARRSEFFEQLLEVSSIDHEHVQTEVEVGGERSARDYLFVMRQIALENLLVHGGSLVRIVRPRNESINDVLDGDKINSWCVNN
ncbi:hypothetical protein PFISCL1PPCAC_2989, partial [Pristionchus fissidentatus]